MAVTKPTRQVINEPYVTKWIATACEERRSTIQAWINSTFRHWFLHQAKALRVYAEEDVQTTAFLQQQAVVSQLLAGYGNRVLETLTFKSLPVNTMPAWAQHAYKEGQIIHFVETTGERLSKFEHMMDYMETLPDRQYFQTFDVMNAAVKKWDEQLAKQKQISDLEVGTEVVFVDESGFKLVKLLTKEARINEGAFMHHCVARDTYGKEDKTIYSWRDLNGESVYTIEVQKRADPKLVGHFYHYLAQIKGKYNHYVSAEDKFKILDMIKVLHPDLEQWRKDGLGRFFSGAGGLRFLDSELGLNLPAACYLQSESRLHRAGTGRSPIRVFDYTDNIRVNDVMVPFPHQEEVLRSLREKVAGMQLGELPLFSAGNRTGKSTLTHMWIDSLAPLVRNDEEDVARQMMILKPRYSSAPQSEVLDNRTIGEVPPFEPKRALLTPKQKLHNLSTGRWSGNPFNTSKPNKGTKGKP